MGVLLLATWRFYWQQPLQALLAFVGIALGVAAINSMDSVHEQASYAHERGLNHLYGPRSMEIVSRDNENIAEQAYAEILRINGRLPLVPWLQGEVRIADQNLDLIGIDPLAPAATALLFQNRADSNQQQLQNARAQTQFFSNMSALLNHSQAVAMAAATAERLGLQQGDTFIANVAGLEVSMVLALTWESEGWADRWIVTDIAQAQVWLNRLGQLDKIIYLNQEQRQLGEITTHLKLPDNLQIRAVDQYQRVERMSQAFYTNLKAMGLLAWLLGIFLAYNAYALISRQRWEEYAHWRTLGVTPVQLVLVLFIDAAVLGSAGGLLGVICGRYMAAVLLPLVTSVGSYFYGGSIASSVLPAPVWYKALLGPLAAWAALCPLAVSIFRQRAMLLKQNAETTSQHANKTRYLALLGIVALGIAMILRSGLVDVSADSVTLGFAVLFFLFIGYALLVPLGIAVLLRLLPSGERIAPALLRQHLSRQGVAQAAFVIALAAGLGIGVMIQSFRDSVVDWLEQILWADYYISTVSAEQHSVLNGSVLKQLSEMPEITKTGGVRESRHQTKDGRWFNVNAYALDASRLNALPLFDGHVDQAHQRWQSGEGLFINESLANQEQLDVGDVIALKAAAGVVTFPILAVNADYSADEGALVIAWQHYARLFDDANFDAMGMVLNDGVSIDTIKQKLMRILPENADVRWIQQQGVYQRSLEVFDQTFSVTRAGRWLILIIALVAVAGAMTAMVLAQRPWLGTLRALGVTPNGLSAIILEQGLLLALCAALLSLPLGLGVSWVLSQDIMRVSFGWLLPVQIQWNYLVVVILQAILVALVASVYPAWRWRNENLRHSKLSHE